MTLVHLAEELAGRRMFLRWAMVPEGIVPARVGGCSSGFERLAPVIARHESRALVGASLWRIFSAQDALISATAAIAAHPAVTHCADAGCARCTDAIAGGPEW
jgi:aminoglycoside 3-N-acetyltransferase